MARAGIDIGGTKILGVVLDDHGTVLAEEKVPTPRGLDALVQASDHVIAEMTYAEPGQMHLSRVDILRLMKAHPGVRFMLTHRGTDQAVDGAVLARDFLTLRLPLS